jgi:hypothetical protein
MTDLERKHRLAAALRENLKRRKAQARQAAMHKSDGSDGDNADSRLPAAKKRDA